MRDGDALACARRNLTTLMLWRLGVPAERLQRRYEGR